MKAREICEAGKEALRSGKFDQVSGGRLQCAVPTAADAAVLKTVAAKEQPTLEGACVLPRPTRAPFLLPQIRLNFANPDMVRGFLEVWAVLRGPRLRECVARHKEQVDCGVRDQQRVNEQRSRAALAAGIVDRPAFESSSVCFRAPQVGHTGDLAATTFSCALVDQCVKVRWGEGPFAASTSPYSTALCSSSCGIYFPTAWRIYAPGHRIGLSCKMMHAGSKGQGGGMGSDCMGVIRLLPVPPFYAALLLNVCVVLCVFAGAAGGGG